MSKPRSSLEKLVDPTRRQQLRVSLFDLGMELPAFGVDVILKQPLRGGELVEGPIHGRIRHRLILRHVEGLVVRKDQAIRHCRTLHGIEGEHLLNGIDARGCDLGVNGSPRLLGRDWRLLDEAPGRASRRQPLEVCLCGSADDHENFLDLVEVVLSGEDGLSADELTEDAPNRPHVDGLRVLGCQEHYLGRAVPPRDDVVGEGGIVLVVSESPGKAEVTDLQVAVFVHQDVGRLQVAVHNIATVKVEQSPQDLVGEVLVVLVVEHLILGLLLAVTAAAAISILRHCIARQAHDAPRPWQRYPSVPPQHRGAYRLRRWLLRSLDIAGGASSPI
mmetsp:Transcript_101244/g.226038  ORF Transcript_101244/g.226038 Transcript_101244/m.226038 type:complete len:332 (-) Transcript_101244:178-1173(-)